MRQRNIFLSILNRRNLISQLHSNLLFFLNENRNHGSTNHLHNHTHASKSRAKLNSCLEPDKYGRKGGLDLGGVKENSSVVNLGADKSSNFCAGGGGKSGLNNKSSNKEYKKYNSTREMPSLEGTRKINKKETFYLSNRLKHGKSSFAAGGQKIRQTSNSKDKLNSLDSTMKSKRFFHSEGIFPSSNVCLNSHDYVERESYTNAFHNHSNNNTVKISSLVTPKVNMVLGKIDILNS